MVLHLSTRWNATLKYSLVFLCNSKSAETLNPGTTTTTTTTAMSNSNKTDSNTESGITRIKYNYIPAETASFWDFKTGEIVFGVVIGVCIVLCVFCVFLVWRWSQRRKALLQKGRVKLEGPGLSAWAYYKIVKPAHVQPSAAVERGEAPVLIGVGKEHIIWNYDAAKIQQWLTEQQAGHETEVRTTHIPDMCEVNTPNNANSQEVLLSQAPTTNDAVTLDALPQPHVQWPRWENGSRLEYFSATHLRWLPAKIDVRFSASGKLVYDVELRRTLRRYVDIKTLRSPLHEDEPVEIYAKSDGQWHPALVTMESGRETSSGYTIKALVDKEKAKTLQLFGTLRGVPSERLRRRFSMNDQVLVYAGVVRGFVYMIVAARPSDSPAHLTIDGIMLPTLPPPEEGPVHAMFRETLGCRVAVGDVLHSVLRPDECQANHRLRESTPGMTLSEAKQVASTMVSCLGFACRGEGLDGGFEEIVFKSRLDFDAMQNTQSSAGDANEHKWSVYEMTREVASWAVPVVNANLFPEANVYSTYLEQDVEWYASNCVRNRAECLTSRLEYLRWKEPPARTVPHSAPGAQIPNEEEYVRHILSLPFEPIVNSIGCSLPLAPIITRIDVTPSRTNLECRDLLKQLDGNFGHCLHEGVHGGASTCNGHDDKQDEDSDTDTSIGFDIDPSFMSWMQVTESHVRSQIKPQTLTN